MAIFQDSDLSISEIQAELNLNAYFSLAAFTLLYYDYILTLRQEVSRYWGTRITWATFLFYLNRYGCIFATLPVILENFWTSEGARKWKVCHSLQTYHQIVAMLAQLVVGVMLVMRTYALYGKSIRALSFMLFGASGGLGFGIWGLISAKEMTPSTNPVEDIHPFVGCGVHLSFAVSRRLGYAWMGMLAFDIMIFIMTVRKAFENAGVMTGQRKGQLILTLVRDGALYFLIMGLANGGNIASFMFAGQYLRGVGTTLTNVLSSILISRLMFNLRDPRLTARVTIIHDPSDNTTMQESLTPFTTTVEPYYETGASIQESDVPWLEYDDGKLPVRDSEPGAEVSMREVRR
ncbi:hypothetical protein R3P38DRAFT_73715 [Favolaschia claudopus]|uniref:DUF6533 domain-containing protein n=1 Tax=Favolaschia claudopus TaxID=2862362 RepID=A0AAW0D276_9AGAR